MKADDKPAYLTVGTEVSAKFRGAFCEAKIKTVKRLVKVKVLLKQDNTTQFVQDDQVKGPLRVGAVVETRTPDGSFQEAVISKLTDASWYTVVFDDGDELTLTRSSLCPKGERHFAESATLNYFPLINPEEFGKPVIAKKTDQGRKSSLSVNEDEKEEKSSEEEDKQRLNDEFLGKVVTVVSMPETTEWYPALVVSPSCNDDIPVKKDQCLVRSFIDSKFYAIARKDIKEVDILNLPESELSTKPGLQKASIFLKARVVPDNWKMDLSEILQSSSSDDEDVPDKEKEKETKKEEKVPKELDPKERDNFLQQLYKFMEDRGTPINRPPVLGYKDINFFKLFRLVYLQGGGDHIDSSAVWKQIYMDLGLPILSSCASYNVKTAYRKYLYGFEEYCRSANIRFRTIQHHKPKTEEETTEDKLKDNDLEHKDVDVDCETTEKDENRLVLGRKNTPKPKEKKVRKQEGTDRDSEGEGEEEKSQEREETERECDSEGEEDEEDTEPCLIGTRVQVKYVQGKTQNIYEARIKSTEINDGEVLYLIHYYGWNVRYDEWVKADRIIWPLDKGGPKKKQNKKAENKEDSEKDRKREEERQMKQGRPSLQSSLPSGSLFGLPKAAHGEAKSDSCSSHSETEDPLEKSLINEELFPDSKEELEKNENFNNDTLHEENPKIAGYVLKDNDRTAAQPLETLLLEGGENEQNVQLFGNQGEKVKKEAERSPKGKGSGSKTKDISLEMIKISSFGQADTGSEPQVDAHSLEFSSLDSKNFVAAGDEIYPYGKERKLKWKIPGQWSEEKLRMENGMRMKNSVSQDRTGDCIASEETKSLQLEPENEGMLSEASQCGWKLAYEELKCPAEETASAPIKEEEDAMPLIGPETLHCYEVDLDDLDEEDKPGAKDAAMENSEASSLVSMPPAVAPAGPHSSSAASPLGLSQDESQRVRSESYPTIGMDGTAEGSLEGPCECKRPTASRFDAGAGPAACSLIAQERKSREKDKKRPRDGDGGLKAKKQKRTPKRSRAVAKNEKNRAIKSSDSEALPAVNNSSKCTPVKRLSVSKPPKHAQSPARISPHIKDRKKEKQREKHPISSPRTYKWSLQPNELDNMNSAERISFLQKKIQEIRERYMSLKSEVASIDRRRKMLKRKEREVAHAGASRSSASSDTGISPSSSSPHKMSLM